MRENTVLFCLSCRNSICACGLSSSTRVKLDIGEVDEWWTDQHRQWYRSLRDGIRTRSLAWWKQRAWTQRVWRRRGLDRVLDTVDVDMGQRFFDPQCKQGACVYVWGPASGIGELYVGSSSGGMFMGAGAGDRLFGHLAHVRKHKRGECRCTRRVYVRAAQARDIREWVFIPVAVLGVEVSSAALLRLEAQWIRRFDPQLNTVGVSWWGRCARKERVQPRRRQRVRPGRDRRGRHIVSAGCERREVGGATVRWSSSGDLAGVDLQKLLMQQLRSQRDGGEQPCGVYRWSMGGAACAHVTNMVTVVRKWGSTPVIVVCGDGSQGQWVLLRSLPVWIRRWNTGVVLVPALHVTKVWVRRRWVCDLVRAVATKHRFTFLARIYMCSSEALLWIWRRTVSRPPSVGRSKILQVVRSEMWRRHQLRVRQRYVLRLPFQRGFRARRLLRELVEWSLRRTALPPSWVGELVSRLSVVFSQRPSIGQMLDNHRKFAQGFDVEKPPQCTCVDHPVWSVWRGGRPRGEHVQVLLSECDGDVVQRVSRAGSAFVPAPSMVLSGAEVVRACTDFAGQVCGPTVGMMKQWGADGRRRVREVVRAAVLQQHDLRGAPTDPSVVATADVHRVRRLLDGLVVSPVDRNVKDRLVECPVLYWKGYRETFWTGSYRERVAADAETEQQILARWEREYVAAGWSRYAALLPGPRRAVPGTAYTMVKMKDLAADSPHVRAPRRRPLTPYGGRGAGSRGHPMRTLMRMCGAALRVAMEAAELRCWHLQSTSGFSPRMDAIWERLRCVGAGQPQRRVCHFPFDVKSMFTELSKDAVLDAVKWVLLDNPGWHRRCDIARLQKQRRRSHRYPTGLHVTASGGERPTARVLWGARQRVGEKFLPLQVVLDVVRFDLRESVMKCGRHLLWQDSGIPMGSFLSALLAGLTVAVAEHRFYQRLPPEIAQRVEGVRYADDGTVVIVEWAGVPEAKTVFQRFVDECYPAPLELEVEEHEGAFKLLECDVQTFPEGSGWTMHRSKTWGDWLKTGRGRFRVWTGPGSWTATQRGVLIGTLLRADACCTKRPEVFPLRVRALLRVLVEAQKDGGYTMPTIRRTLRYLVKSASPRDVLLWQVLALGAQYSVSMGRLYLQFCASVRRAMEKLVAWC